MSTEIVAILIGVALLIVLATGFPVSFSMLGISVVALLVFYDFHALQAIYSSVWEVSTSEVLIATPMFVFMSCILQFSGIGSAMYECLYKLFAGLRGGLAIGTVAMCTLIAAMSGSASTGVVTMGILAYPEMSKRGYSKSISIGCIPSGGALGQLIPPSIGMIIIASFGHLSVGRLFMGGVFPGLLMSFLFMLYIAIRCYLQPQMAPPTPIEERVTWKGKLASLSSLFAPIALIFFVLGSIYTGAATPSEAGAIGAFGAFVVAVAYRQLNLRNLKQGLMLSVRVTCMVMWLVIGGSAFSSLLGITGVRDLIKEVMLGLEVSPLLTVGIMQLVVVVLGMFMDQGSISVICIPIFMPIIWEIGMDPTWFAILFAVTMILGNVTPPFGIAMFFTKGIMPPEVSMTDIYLSSAPYIPLILITIVVSWLWPPLLTFLPDAMI